MPAITKTTRQAQKSVTAISGMLKKAQKHHRQATKTVARIRSVHKQAKGHLKKTGGTKKGMSRKTARKAYM